MTWFKVDVDFLTHPKFIRAIDQGGSAAVHLWASMMGYAKKHRTRGRLSHVEVNAIAGPAQGRWRVRALQALLDVGLIDQVDDGYQIHDYLEWNPETRSPGCPEQSHDEDRTDPEQSHDAPDTPSAPSIPLSDSDGLRPLRGIPRARARAVPSQSKSKSESSLSAPKRSRGAPRWRNVVEAFPEWQPNAFHEALARKYGRDLKLEAAKFKDHDFGVPRSDPDRTFNNWLRGR